ncbi:MAG: ABC transporter ATP-binding protein/permease [Proteobacteria bacterium]|nr:ABC transporter ATP-binding protein/permease [Pseudomonadota bacterium]
MNWARFLWSYVSFRKDLLAALLACSAIMAAAELAVPWLIKQVIDAVLGDDPSVGMNGWLLLALGVLAALYVAHVFLLRVDALMILHASYDLRRRLLHHIHGQALSFFGRHRSGELTHRLTSDTKLFETAVARLFRDIPSEILVVIGVTVLMVMLHPGLALVVIVFMLAAAALTGYLGQPLPSLRKSAQRVSARLAARFQETLAGVRTVQGFNNEAHELARLDEENRGVLKLELKEGKVYALMEPLGDMVELVGLVLVVWYGGRLILADEITAGTLVAFIAYMEILARPLGHVEAYVRSIQTSRAVGERLQDLLADREQLPRDGRFSVDAAPSVAMEGVSFRYPGAERSILCDVSFVVQPGEVVAVAGRNGAGKSTLMDLLLRFHDSEAGRVLAAGVDLREWDLDAWRGSVGVMPQEIFLFQSSIHDNVTYGRPDAAPEEVDEAVRASGLDRILRRFPDGLQTEVGERGAQLSGGERQSIALARLFLRRPKLLILDEPTSQLDGEALQLVRAALRPLMAGCTTFIVTHNLDTIQLADRVLFLEGGRLVADGAHQALYTQEPRYRALWDESGSAANGTATRAEHEPSTTVG